MQLVMAFYSFARWPDYRDHREPLRELCATQDLLGSILLAAEGVNGTVVGQRVALDQLVMYLQNTRRFSDLNRKYSALPERGTTKQPFHRMRVRLKREIVSLGQPGVDPSQTGTFVEAAEWNSLLAAEDVVLIDTRNDYEVAIGTFPGALNPETQSFREFPQWLEDNPDIGPSSKIAMFCTGGIRCEKASAYLKQQGYRDVHQLRGGILAYLEQVPPTENQWQGDCYVFDGRVSVTSDLEPGQYEVCPNCNSAIGPKQRTETGYQRGVTCSTCVDTISPDRERRFAERQRQIELATQRGEAHLGAKPSSRQEHGLRD